ncbi:LPXTG cell wall anchor domain-containing protein [Levyella massiliensis]|uniref:LPXTG cell wall anchor domain-containing protein n=1 Tax=Levyella massiliensis TaxID=938289 RepID=UPI00036945C8|nr:LPXTG cell wall anchor domain-containing protein [Levyella massiliensis]
MKTKRIVALALAGALALGAVTPAFAEEAKETKNAETIKLEELTAKKTSEAYGKIVEAQANTVEEAQSNYDKAVKYEAETKKEDESARQWKAKRAADLKNAQDAIDEVKDKIDALSALQLDVRNAKDHSEMEYSKKFNKANPLRNEKAYRDAIIYAKNTHDAAGAAALQEQLDYFLVKIKPFQDRDEKLVEDIDNAKLSLKALTTKKDIAQAKYDDAEKWAQETQEKWTQAWKDMIVKKHVLATEEDNLNRIKELQGYFTEKTIKNETNPALVKLAKEDFLTYFLVKLQADDWYITESTLKKLNLSEDLLKQYHDVLADEGSVAPAESSQEEESKKPDESKPNEEKPGTSEDKPAPVVPGKEDKPATDKKDNKKDNKKATKKSNKAPKTGDIAVLAYAGTAVLAAGAYVASKKRK